MMAEFYSSRMIGWQQVLSLNNMLIWRCGKVKLFQAYLSWYKKS
jgi:hypothetical protein